MFNNIYAYWYAFIFDGIDNTTEVYYVTLDAPIQQIVDLWDGVKRPVASVFLKRSSKYQDNTSNVLEEDYVYGTNATSTYMSIGELTGGATPASWIMIGFAERMTAIDFVMITGNEQNNAVMMNIEYWNGSAWTTVGDIDDGTLDDNCALGKSGIAAWNAVAESLEFKTSVSDSELWYYYKISFSGTLSGTTPGSVRIDYIGGIPAQKSIHGYLVPVYWQNRLWLFNEKSGRQHSAIASTVDTVVQFNGENAISPDTPFLFGGEEEIVAATTLYSRFSGGLYESLVVFKKREVWLVDYSPTSDADGNLISYASMLTKYKLSDNYGCVAPQTLLSCDTGYEISPGLLKHVLIWQSQNGIMLFDGNTILPVSEDIKNFFDDTKSEAIPASMIDNSSAFYDEKRFEYHWCFASGASATSINKEFVYSLIYKKWFEIDRSTGAYLVMGVSVADTNGKSYTYGGIDTGYLMRLENGTTFAKASGSNDIVSTFRSGDIAMGGWGAITKITHVKHIVIAKATTTNSVTISYFGDGITTAHSNTISHAVKSTTRRILQQTRSVNWGSSSSTTDKDNCFHSIQCSLTTSNEDVGYEPIGLAIRYQTLREELM